MPPPDSTAKSLDRPMQALVAVYGNRLEAPSLYEVSRSDARLFLSTLADTVNSLARELGGGIPPEAVEEVIDNLIHAGLHDPTVSILEFGNLILVADQGPGISDKARARLPGFSTGTPDARTVIRGVGAGLSRAGSLIEERGGSLEIEDNLGGGTVVRLWVPGPAPQDTQEKDARPPEPALGDRQLRMLLLVVELGPVGPTALAKEMHLSASTAYRELEALESRGLVESDPRGRRTISANGMSQLKTLL